MVLNCLISRVKILNNVRGTLRLGMYFLNWKNNVSYLCIINRYCLSYRTWPTIDKYVVTFDKMQIPYTRNKTVKDASTMTSDTGARRASNMLNNLVKDASTMTSDTETSSDFLASS